MGIFYVLLSSFWLTWTIQLIVLLLITTATFIFYRIRINKLKNEKSDLERQVIERNELLSYSKLNEQKARKDFEIANKNKTMLISKISHDIRTPLNAIMGMASLLNEASLTPEQQEYTATIQNSGERLLGVVNEILMNDILEYSKVDSGNELEEKDFDLRNNIEEVLDVFAVKAEKVNVDLVYQIDPKVPRQISGDAFRLRQVLMNFVENSFRSTMKGEIFIEVKCVEYRENNKLKLQFAVSDTGTGMTPAKLALLSESLRETETSDETNNTVDLALVICRKLVSLMDGTIKVESRENEGSTFTFTIWTRTSQKALRADPNTEMSGLEKRKILIVDDNATVANTLKNQLKQWKLATSAANSAKEAIEILAQDPSFDLVISDLRMPGTSGLELTRTIKLLYAEMPVILLINTGDESYREHAELFSAVISKPVKQHILNKQVFSALRQKSGNATLNNEQKDKHKLSADFSRQYPLSILVAEDDKINQKFALKILSKLGYEAHIASNGQEVLELVSQKNYDIVLMDVQMPVMNGLEATKMIRLCLTEQPRIVAMTANTLQGDREECMMAGMDDYISKPINVKDLVTVLEKCALQMSHK